MPAYAVTTDQIIKLPPKVVILHRLPICGSPTSTFPVNQPLADPATQILRISVCLHATWSFQRLECTNSGGKLHPVIGRCQPSAPDFLFSACCAQHGAP